MESQLEAMFIAAPVVSSMRFRDDVNGGDNEGEPNFEWLLWSVVSRDTCVPCHGTKVLKWTVRVLQGLLNVH